MNSYMKNTICSFGRIHDAAQFNDERVYLQLEPIFLGAWVLTWPY